MSHWANSVISRSAATTVLANVHSTEREKVKTASVNQCAPLTIFKNVNSIKAWEQYDFVCYASWNICDITAEAKRATAASNPELKARDVTSSRWAKNRGRAGQDPALSSANHQTQHLLVTHGGHVGEFGIAVSHMLFSIWPQGKYFFSFKRLLYFDAVTLFILAQNHIWVTTGHQWKLKLSINEMYL